jgi:hypothetical protein
LAEVVLVPAAHSTQRRSTAGDGTFAT